MSKLLIINGHNKQWVYVEDTIIVDAGTHHPPVIDDVELIDADGCHILPGFIDIHVHGAWGFDTMDATPVAIQNMAQCFAQHGVTSFLATTWTASQERITAALTNIQENIGPQPSGATLLGAHVEGPYLNPKKAGAQSRSEMRRADKDEAIPFLDTNVIHLLSIAPEFAENHWLIAEANSRNITVSIAHTNATYQEAKNGFKQGITHATHIFNAMTGLHHRKPGVVGAILEDENVFAELIADNIHVHPSVMNILWKAKQPYHLILITDAVRVTGLKDGQHQLDNRVVSVQTGVVSLSDGTLAGSILTMDRAFKNFAQATNEPIENIWQTTSLNPAMSLGIDDYKGKLSAGYDADIVLMNENFEIQKTIALGKIVYEREG